jgi:hypothetical protein
MPPVVADQFLLSERLALIDGEYDIGHGASPEWSVF